MSLLEWWRRVTTRGAHRRGQPRGSESVHAVVAAARAEQARVSEARARQLEAEAFMRDFRHAFGIHNGHGTGAR